MAGQVPLESEIVFMALGATPNPPVDLQQIAENIRVGAIRDTSFRAGFTDFSLATPVIYLNNTQLETTKRFILAHELAHVMLRMPKVIRLIQKRGRADLLTDEEEFADRIAGAILVPESLIEALRRTCHPSKQLRNISRLANVSVMMLVARMASSGIDIAALHWRRGDNAWHVIDRPGTPASLHGYVKPSTAGHWAIENLYPEESSIVVDCYVNGRHAKIAGRGYRQDKHAFQVLEPSVDIWIASDLIEQRSNRLTLADVDYRLPSTRDVRAMSDTAAVDR